MKAAVNDEERKNYFEEIERSKSFDENKPGRVYRGDQNKCAELFTQECGELKMLQLARAKSF